MGSGPYLLPEALRAGQPASELASIRLDPSAEALAQGRPPLEFLIVRDDAQRAMKLIRGDADAAQNSLSLTKTRWLAARYADRFDVIERKGVNVQYVAFNLGDPLLSDRRVREGISLSDALNQRHFLPHVAVEMIEVGESTGALAEMLTDPAQRATWSRNGLAFADTADLYSMPQRAADVILGDAA